jgi:hypothetical protein
LCSNNLVTAAVRKAKFDRRYAISIFTLISFAVFLTEATATQVALSVSWNARTIYSITSRFCLRYSTALNQVQQSVKTAVLALRSVDRLKPSTAVRHDGSFGTAVIRPP